MTNWNKNAMSYDSKESKLAEELKDKDEFGKEAFYFRENQELKNKVAELERDVRALKFDMQQLTKQNYELMNKVAGTDKYKINPLHPYSP